MSEGPDRLVLVWVFEMGLSIDGLGGGSKESSLEGESAASFVNRDYVLKNGVARQL